MNVSFSCFPVSAGAGSLTLGDSLRCSHASREHPQLSFQGRAAACLQEQQGVPVLTAGFLGLCERPDACALAGTLRSLARACLLSVWINVCALNFWLLTQRRAPVSAGAYAGCDCPRCSHLTRPSVSRGESQSVGPVSCI